MTERGKRKLRILAVVNLPWDLRLGAARVWIELAEHWRSAGHTVDSYSLTDAFPRPARSGAVFALRQVWFARRASRFIQARGDQYDVIDALLGTVTQSKQALGFQGLLVARSVGFYWLYHKFNERARERWPDRRRGKLSGRILYTLTRQNLLQAADEAVGCADLINLANEDELASLRRDLRSEKPAMVQPYGLTEERRRAFHDAALSAEERLAKQRICFIGQWSVRKGSRDWPEIVRQLRALNPRVRFRFLGTMAGDSTMRDDLQAKDDERLEFVSEYEPQDLPRLLSDCTIGVFPSYVEGFGFAVLEQLAAGLPTVAYDVPGPRQILRKLRPALLAPAGEIGALVQRAREIMDFSATEYDSLRQQCLAIARGFSWPQIAADTIRAYREAIRRQDRPILFTQPFGLHAPGGGARILRALLESRPRPITMVCTSPDPPVGSASVNEIHLPLRPSLGRLERTRFAGLAQPLGRLFSRRFVRRLKSTAIETNACALHAIAHGGLDFYYAFRISRDLAVPFFLHVHDDFIYSSRIAKGTTLANQTMGEAWRGASARFVIGRELGEEYCRRYGLLDYVIVTDGLEEIAASPLARDPERLRVYFMGLFHLEYEPNLRSLLNVLRRLREESRSITITLRCGVLRQNLQHEFASDLVCVLPFGSEGDVKADLAIADVLYLPLPFEQAHESFVRLSLSTKLVTYLGSGLPILYHGPTTSAVYGLLKEHEAAFFATSPDEQAVEQGLRLMRDETRRDKVVANALALAESQFMLVGIRERFWQSIAHSLGA